VGSVVLFSNVCGFLARAPSVALTPLQIAEEIGAEVENIITAEEEEGGGAERTSSCNVEYYGSTLLPDLRPEKEASQLRRDHLLCIIIIIIMCLLHHHRHHHHHHHHVPSNLGGV
jgi:hypothetical protein